MFKHFYQFCKAGQMIFKIADKFIILRFHN